MREGTKSKLTVAAAALAMFGLIGLMGHMDYEDERKFSEAYCMNVYDHVWPDHRGTYKRDCENGHLKK